MVTPSGIVSVSTVAGGLETPDFIELRKNTSGVREVGEPSGQRQLYQVVPERQTNIRGLMGSERGYDISAVSGAANVEVLGQEGRGKVRRLYSFSNLTSTDRFPIHVFRTYSARAVWRYRSTLPSWMGCPKINCGSGTTKAVVLLVVFMFLAPRRTSRIWSPRMRHRQPKSGKRRVAVGRGGRKRRISSFRSCAAVG